MITIYHAFDVTIRHATIDAATSMSSTPSGRSRTDVSNTAAV